MASRPRPLAKSEAAPMVATEPVQRPIKAGTERTKKSVKRRDDILAAAAELFDRQGYSNTSLDDVARAVGIKREALYYYYRNRSEILLAIIRPQSLALISGLQEILLLDAPASDRLRLGIENHLKRFDRYCLEMTVSLRDGLFETSEEVRSSMARIWKGYELLWIQLIADGQREGVFNPSADAKMVAFGILGMCNWLARWYDPQKSESLDSIIDTFFNLVGFGLVVPGARETLKTRR